MPLLWLTAWFACAPVEDPAEPVPDSDLAPDTDPPAPLALTFIPWNPPRTPLRLGLGALGGEVYTSTVQGVEASADLGRTWELRGPVSSLTVTSAALFDTSGAGLRRSTDGGRTFVPLTLPPALPPSELARIHVDGEGALWLLSRANPPLVLRSDDLGDTLAPVDLPPDTTTLAPCDAAGGVMTAVRDYAEVVQWQADAWTLLGPAENPASCFVTAAGTVLVSARDTETVTLRWPVGADAWERHPGIGATTTRQLDSGLARVLTNGRVDRSLDDGVSWERAVTEPGGAFVVGAVDAVGDTLVGLYGSSVLRLGPADLAWTVETAPGLPPFLRVIDFTIAPNGRMALLLLENLSHVLYVTDAAGTWWRGLGFDAGQARTVALSPDGERAFIGGANGRFLVVADRGARVERDHQLNDSVGTTERGAITGVVWGADVLGQGFVIASAAEDNDTGGGLWLGDATDDFGTWRRITPLRTGTSVALRLGGYHALALAPRQPPVGEALFAGMRSFVSAGSYTQQLLYKPELFDTNAEWFEAQPPVQFEAPLAAAWRGAYLQGLATLWPNNQLYYGIGAGLQQPVSLADVPGEATLVRFDPAGVMWIGTDTGLWRTAAPVP